MDDANRKAQLEAILATYTLEQRATPDKKYGTMDKRIAAAFHEDPLKAETEFQKEAADQQNEVNKRAAALAGDA